MNEQIDWSQAPEGATHYVPAPNDLHHPIWLKMDGKTVLNAGYIGHDHWAHTYTRGSQPCTDLSNAIARPTTPSWSGEGLPPVGVVCEVDWCEEWHKCEVIAHFQQRCGMVAAFTVEISDGAKSLDAFGAGSFRPIRTTEQISADEREAAIERACADIEKRIEGFNVQLSYSLAIRATIEAMIDKGYRKP